MKAKGSRGGWVWYTVSPTLAPGPQEEVRRQMEVEWKSRGAASAEAQVVVAALPSQVFPPEI